jgi:hypothetical protein
MGRLFVAAFGIVLVLAAYAACAADSPETCWVCAIHPPAPGDSQELLRNTPHVTVQPDVIPKDTQPRALFDLESCDPKAQLILNCDHFTT